jgi:hypothetical protein
MVKRVAVLVLGDVARSPRMQYHALSLATQANFHVDLIGYNGEFFCTVKKTKNSILCISIVFHSKFSFIT